MFDPDDNSDAIAEGEALHALLNAMEHCDLGDWDSDFVNDLLKRVNRTSAQTVAASLTAKQRNQITRMKGKYDVEEADPEDFF
jgi:hypothetical protein